MAGGESPFPTWTFGTCKKQRVSSSLRPLIVMHAVYDQAKLQMRWCVHQIISRRPTKKLNLGVLMLVWIVTDSSACVRRAQRLWRKTTETRCQTITSIPLSLCQASWSLSSSQFSFMSAESIARIFCGGSSQKSWSSVIRHASWEEVRLALYFLRNTGVRWLQSSGFFLPRTRNDPLRPWQLLLVKDSSRTRGSSLPSLLRSVVCSLGSSKMSAMKTTASLSAMKFQWTLKLVFHHREN
mmetsp:Transcript_10776/g.24053  ORF Transcript_10776/g.24053 Transcript_10776/m.24053 type:complete len:239 (+) Transcript_10776:719-1435(+)